MRLALLTVALLSSLLIGAVPANRVALSVPLAVYVQGAGMVDQSGAPLVLRGVGRDGAEYNCMHGTVGQSVVDGPSDQASIDVLKSIGVNAVRIPTNEDCVLGINASGNAYVGAAYEQNLQSYVNLLNANGIYAILDLHWSAPGTYPAGGQEPAADLDHAPAFWREMARLFSSNPAVIFDLHNEPNGPPCCSPDFVSWQNTAFKCLRDGVDFAGKPCDAVPDANKGQTGTYPMAGMQTLVDAIRGTGATNVLMVGGIQAAETITQYRGDADVPGQYMPTDALHQLAVSVHVYPIDACSDLSCWNGTYLPVAAHYPIIAGEVGEAGQTCTGSYVALWMPFAALHSISTIGWTWNPFTLNGAPSCDALVTDNKGTLNGGFGQSFVRGMALFQSSPITGTATPGNQPTIIQATPLSATATITPSATLAPVLDTPTLTPTAVLSDTATLVPSSTPVPPTRTATALPTSTAPPALVPSVPPLPSATPLRNVTIPGLTCYAQTTLFLGRHWYACVPGG